MAGSIGLKPKKGSLSNNQPIDSGWIAFAGTGSFTTGSSPYSWSSPGNVLADDANPAAYFNLSGTAESSTLSCQQLAATGIDDSASIVGVQVVVNRATPAAEGDYVDVKIKLIVDGGEVGTNQSSGDDWLTTEEDKIFGGIGDTWGNTLTGADINASDFGVAVSCQPTGTFKTANIDYIAMRFWYR